MIDNDVIKLDISAKIRGWHIVSWCTWCGGRMKWQWSIPTTQEANSPYQHRFYCPTCEWRVTIETDETD